MDKITRIKFIGITNKDLEKLCAYFIKESGIYTNESIETHSKQHSRYCIGYADAMEAAAIELGRLISKYKGVKK